MKYGDYEAVHPANVADEAQRVAGQRDKIRLPLYHTKDIAVL